MKSSSHRFSDNNPVYLRFLSYMILFTILGVDINHHVEAEDSYAANATNYTSAVSTFFTIYVTHTGKPYLKSEK